MLLFKKEIERGMMLLFKSFLASLGVGAAKIDLILNNDYVTMNEQTEGKIVLTAGDVDQKIEGLFVDFKLNSRFSKEDQTVFVNENVARIPVTKEEFVINPGQVLEFPFSFRCPSGLPVSSVNTRYFFQTNLEIKSGIDSKDRDFVHVMPSGLVKHFMEGFERLGFVHRAEGYTGKRRGDRQMIQFHPTSWLRGEYDEIEFSYSPGSSQYQISGFFELDKRTSGVMGMLADKMDLDEKKGRYTFSAAQLATTDQAEETIRRFIIENSRNLYG